MGRYHLHQPVIKMYQASSRQQWLPLEPPELNRCHRGYEAALLNRSAPTNEVQVARLTGVSSRGPTRPVTVHPVLGGLATSVEVHAESTYW